MLVSPESRTEVEAVLPSSLGFPLEIREEPTLAEGQVFIRAGEIERGTVVVVRNVAGARSGQAARQDAGPMVAQVVGALVGASVPGATRALTLVSPPAATYRAGHQYIPSAFEAETIFRKPQNP